MDAEKQLEFVRAVLTLGDGFNDCGDLWDSIWWRTDDEYKPVTFFVNCNDMFYWAMADCETLTSENLPALLQAIADVRAATGARQPERGAAIKDHAEWSKNWDRWYHAGGQGAALFCARERKMRPQRPWSKGLSSELKALFDECGPERDKKDEG